MIDHLEESFNTLVSTINIVRIMPFVEANPFITLSIILSFLFIFVSIFKRTIRNVKSIIFLLNGSALSINYIKGLF